MKPNLIIIFIILVFHLKSATLNSSTYNANTIVLQPLPFTQKFLKPTGIWRPRHGKNSAWLNSQKSLSEDVEVEKWQNHNQTETIHNCIGLQKRATH